MAGKLLRRELLKRAALAGAGLAVPFVFRRYARAEDIDPARLKKLAESLKGQVIVPQDATYDSARKIWNARYDGHPAAIARCANADDVRRAVEFVRANNFAVAVRSGGHSFAGYSTCDGGIVIDLSALSDLRVEPRRRVAKAQPGVRVREFDAATKPLGLATTMGGCSEVALGGLCLGAGQGFLASKFGNTCDNLLGAEVITADGELLRASNDQNPDLFWAIRGGGGNFGIATSFDLQLHPIDRLAVANLTCSLAEAPRAMRKVRDFVASIGDDVCAYAGVMPANPDGTFQAMVAYEGAGNGERVLAPLGASDPAITSSIKSTPYFDIQAQGQDIPTFKPIYGEERSGYFGELSDDAIDTIGKHLASARPRWSGYAVFFTNGAASRIPISAAAYPWRQPAWEYWVHSYWQDPNLAGGSIDWVTAMFESLKPYSTGAVYVNMLYDEGESRVRAAYGPNYDRLAQLKKNATRPTSSA